MTDQLPREAADPGPFEGVEGRRSVDYLLRNAQQQLVALGGQADFKASVMITASAIVTSIAASQLTDDDLRVPAGVLASFVVLALLASVLAVFPKFQRLADADGPLPADFNPLFFGHYAEIPKDQYIDEMATIVRRDDTIYRTIVNDLYDQGLYLVRAKYRFLRVSYAFFIAGFITSGVTLIVTSIID